MRLRKILTAAAGAVLVAASSPASAVITLNLVNSYVKGSSFNGPFGLAFDGTNIWYSMGNGSIHEMTTSGVDTGNVVNGPYWSALAFNTTTNQLVVMQGTGITSFNRSTSGTASYTTLSPSTTTIAGANDGLIDGLDMQGSTLWWSPDVDNVYTSPAAGGGSRTTFLGGAGGYSGVEFLSVGGTDYVVVVNDASSPRQLCVHSITAVLIGCTTLANSRYEDLAYDGRYLYAADYYGGRIDQIDLLADGASIFQPGVPEPATWAMMLLGFGGIGMAMRRRKPLLQAA